MIILKARSIKTKKKFIKKKTINEVIIKKTTIKEIIIEKIIIKEISTKKMISIIIEGKNSIEKNLKKSKKKDLC